MLTIGYSFNYYTLLIFYIKDIFALKRTNKFNNKDNTLVYISNDYHLCLIKEQYYIFRINKINEGYIMATAIFYASDAGNTEDIAQRIAKELGDIEIFDIGTTDIEKVNEYDKLIFGVSTWGEGDLQSDWEDAEDDFSKIDLSGKTVALFGLGDQEGYDDTFVDAMGILYEKTLEMGANVIGSFDIDSDYDYESSAAVVDGKFVGLAIDEDNQEELSDKRISLWISQIKDQMIN